MHIIQQIHNAFPESLAEESITDEFIINNPNLLEIQEQPDYMIYVPAYILWCVRNRQTDLLVTDFTINALSEFGRCKNMGNSYLNFKYRCNEVQKKAVASFLAWSLNNLLNINNEQIQRSIERWV